MRRKRKKLDWDPLIEEGKDALQQETVADEMASLVHPRVRAQAYAVAGIFGLFKKSIDAENAYAQRCPKCDRHTLVRIQPGNRKSPWQCNNCGNDSDEFGNKL